MSRQHFKPRPNPDWMKTREAHLLTFPCCMVCETTEKLHVHHLRYRGKRGVSEKSGDLVTLCEFHHGQLHRELAKAGHKTSVQGTLDFIARGRLIEALL